MGGDCIRMCNAIRELTDKEVTSVTLHHANADFDGPAYVIDCNGYWTGYQDTRFEGDTQIEALEKAVVVKRAYDQGRTPKCDLSSLQ